VAAIFVVGLLIPFFELLKAGNYWARVTEWLDNASYVEIAEIIRHGRASESLAEPHFWGLPALIATVAAALRVSGFAALIVISIVSSMAAALLMYRLYGKAVVVAFLIFCPEWARLSVMGGSEPLFLCLLLASWVAFRSDRSLVGVLLLSLATLVRPVGFIALCACAFVLILRRDWRRLAVSVCIAVGIGLAYLTWVRAVSGDPFITFRLYSADWPSGNPLAFPFVELSKSIFHMVRDNHWTGWVQPLFSIALVSISLYAVSKRIRTIPRQYPVEVVFLIGYLAFVACYNYDRVADFFPRFVIPVLPFLLFAAGDWLPINRFVVWPLAVFSALIASSALVGFRTVFGFALPH